MTLFIAILKTTILLTLTRLSYIKVNKNETNIDGNISICYDKINNRIINLSSSTKVIKNIRISFFTFEASLTFI